MKNRDGGSKSWLNGKSVNRRSCAVLYTGCLVVAVFLQCTYYSTTTENATAATSKLSGKILQTTSGAKVFIDQGRPIDSTIIDPADGYFALSSLIPGVYKLRIIAGGYDTFSAMIQVGPGLSYDLGGIGLAERTKNFSDTIPSVYDTYPAGGSELIYVPPDKYSPGSAGLYVSVSFDRPMNRESVEKALTITPQMQGGYFVWYQNTKKFTAPASAPTYQWDGAGFYDTLNTVSSGANKMALLDVSSSEASVPSAEITTYSVAKSFTFYFPRSQCRTDTTYTIRISRGAVDTSGTPLDTALTFSFKTVQSAIAYKNIEMLPHDGDDWVPLISSGIALTFPRRMDETSTQAGISVNLKARPMFLWQDYNHLTVYTGGIFAPDTTYVIMISANVKDLDGNPLGTADTLSFRTEPIKITQTTPARGQIGVALTNNIVMTFDTYMDRTSFASRCVLASDDGDTVPGAVNYQYYVSYNSAMVRYDTTFQLSQMNFIPSRSLARNKLYTLTVGAGVKDLNGYAMKEDYNLQFITVP